VHGLPSSQLRAVPGLQVPPWQVSVPLHRLLSAHAVPSPIAGNAHVPAAVHVSWVHGLPSLQLVQLPPPAPHAPALVPV